MMHVIGLELDRALELIKKETGALPAVEKTSPPRGLPCENGLWRVVRADLSRGCITAAFFPLPGEGDTLGDTLGTPSPNPCQGE